MSVFKQILFHVFVVVVVVFVVIAAAAAAVVVFKVWLWGSGLWFEHLALLLPNSSFFIVDVIGLSDRQTG